MSDFVLGLSSRRELTGVHPWLVRVVEVAITLTTQDFMVLDGLRTAAEQAEYVKRGVSQTMASKHLPQEDGTGHAVDLVPYIGGRPRWEWPPIFEIAAAVAKAVPIVNEEWLNAGKTAKRLRWGGAWSESFEVIGANAKEMEAANRRYVSARLRAGKRAFCDGPHFEIVG